jgi:hypothetical protein
MFFKSSKKRGSIFALGVVRGCAKPFSLNREQAGFAFVESAEMFELNSLIILPLSRALLLRKGAI